MARHHKALWVVQWIFGVYFIAVGVTHLVVPDGLPSMLDWMYELDTNIHVVVGIAEILGGVGLILPGLTGIRSELTVYAALGLMVVMVGAAIWHASRGEAQSIATNVFNALAMGYVAYGRWKLAPLTSENGSATASKATGT